MSDHAGCAAKHVPWRTFLDGLSDLREAVHGARSNAFRHMAVNHADGTIFTSVLFCPIAAGAGAAHAGAGWLTVLFVPVGLAVGLGIFRFGRGPVYAITQFGLSRTSRMPKGWIQQLFILPFLLVYMILPLATVWGAAYGVFMGSNWLVRHLF